jgi:hypothetical protein
LTPSLLPLLADPKPEVRFWAIFALKDGPPEVDEHFRRLTRDTARAQLWTVGQEAQWALDIRAGGGRWPKADRAHIPYSWETVGSPHR